MPTNSQQVFAEINDSDLTLVSGDTAIITGVTTKYVVFTHSGLDLDKAIKLTKDGLTLQPGVYRSDADFELVRVSETQSILVIKEPGLLDFVLTGEVVAAPGFSAVVPHHLKKNILAAGAYGPRILDANGNFATWGAYNTVGWIGDGTVTNYVPAKTIVPPEPFVGIFSSGVAGFGLTATGVPYGWGSNGSYILNPESSVLPANVNQPSPVKLQPAHSTIRYTKIAGGSQHALYLDTNGQVTAVGINTGGQCGKITALSPVYGPNIVLTDVVDIAAANTVSLAIKANGDLYSWGKTVVGELGSGVLSATVTTPTKVGEGFKEFLNFTSLTSTPGAIKLDGSIVMWGHNGFHNLQDGTITNSGTPTLMPSKYKDIRPGRCCFGQLHDNTWEVWGSGTSGLHGQNTTTLITVPQAVRDLDIVQYLAATGTFSLGLKADGTTVVAGANNTGQFGMASPASSTKFIPVTNGSITI